MYVWTWIQLTRFGFFTPADSLALGRSQSPIYTFIHSFGGLYLFILISQACKDFLASFHARTDLYHPCQG